jgi:hypothetical protein
MRPDEREEQHDELPRPPAEIAVAGVVENFHANNDTDLQDQA